MATATNTPRLRSKYKDEVIPALMKRFGYKSVMQVPQLEKIAINRGVNGAVNDKKLIDIAIDVIKKIEQKKCSYYVQKLTSAFYYLIKFWVQSF